MTNSEIPTLEEMSKTTGQDIEQLKKDRDAFISNFEINEDVLEASSVDIINEKMREATERIAIERERLLALALHEGYDGVDIQMDTTLMMNYNDYSMGFNYEAWRDEPPTVDRFSQCVQRYDFRVLNDEEKRMLLARIGVDYDE